jgi:hypothetical protein
VRGERGRGDRVREPRAGLQQLEEDLGLLRVGHGLQGEQIDALVDEDPHPLPVEVLEEPARHTIVPPVLRAVGEHGAVRAHGPRDPQWTVEPGHRVAGERHAAGHERRIRGLVARRRDDVGTGPDEVPVSVHNGLRRLGDQPRRPQRAGQVEPHRLEPGRQAAVQDDGGHQPYRRIRSAVAGCTRPRSKSRSMADRSTCGSRPADLRSRLVHHGDASSRCSARLERMCARCERR